MKKNGLCLLLLCLLLLTPALAEENAPYPGMILSETEDSVTFLDCFSEEVTVPKRPKRVVSLFNSMLDLWYMAGGEAVARVNGTENIPPAAQDLPNLGKYTAVSPEAVMALEPDLVLVYGGTAAQADLAKLLKETGIGYIAFDVSRDPYGAMDRMLHLYTKVLGREDLYETQVKGLYARCQEVIDQALAREDAPLVAVLYATGRGVLLETGESQTGQMLSLLGVRNIVDDASIPAEAASRIEFSMEALVAADPDMLLICTMGDVEECRAYIDENLVKNSGWQSLTAVREGKVHYLPKEYTVYKPNAAYPDAFLYLAELCYPEFP